VYGNQPGKVLDENDVLLKVPMLAQRVEHEQQTLKSTEVDGVVVRPGFVYGGKSSPHWLTPNDKGEWIIDGNPNRMYGWIHNQDLARMYVLLVDAAASVVRGQIFNAGDSTRITWAEVKTLVARANGFKGELTKVETGKDFYSQISDASCVVSSQKATKLLGWTPNLGPLQDHIPSCIRSFRAHQSAAKK